MEQDLEKIKAQFYEIKRSACIAEYLLEYHIQQLSKAAKAIDSAKIREQVEAKIQQIWERKFPNLD